MTDIVWIARFNAQHGTLELGPVEVVKRTAKTVHVKGCAASGYRSQVPIDETHLTCDAAIAAVKPEVKVYVDRRRAQLDTLSEAVGGPTYRLASPDCPEHGRACADAHCAIREAL